MECKTPFQLVCYDCVTCFLIIIECGSHFSSHSNRINRKKTRRKIVRSSAMSIYIQINLLNSFIVEAIGLVIKV